MYKNLYKELKGINEDDTKIAKLKKRVEKLEAKYEEAEAKWEKLKGNRRWRFSPEGKKALNRSRELKSDLNLARRYLEQGYDPNEDRPRTDADTQSTVDFFKQAKRSGNPSVGK